ncbi:MAG: oligosaccharide flippase family protein [Porticoccaceae bacterium]|nr:oligosaccharide flippase family protein [Porticoccaceae bacterium]
MSLKKNIVANFSGSIWSALMSLAFVPFYIQLMGVESYGVVGIYVSLVGMLTVLDLGLSQTMNREMARLSHDERNSHQITNTAHTLEVVYWAFAVVIGVGVALLAAPIADHWLNPDQLTRDDLRLAIQIMGLVIGLRWPVSFYIGGLNGLQRQVLLNVLLSIVVTLQGLGALAVLWFVEPTIKAFFMWQAVTALLQVVIFRGALWRSLPLGHSSRFDKNILNEIWRFAAGMSGISLLAAILTQLDKVVLSKILSLTEFGYYAFATAVAGVVFRLIGPVFAAYYPRLTELVSQDNQESLVKTYHQGSQVMAVSIFPVALVLIFFSNEILDLWTHNQNLIFHTSLLISLLTIGNALNGMMHLPYSLQLAHGWTGLALVQNIVAVIVLAPAIYFSTIRWGTTGAAVIWIILNATYLLIGNHVMHLKLLKNDKWQWYFDDLIKPLISVLAVCWLAQLILTDEMSFWSKVTVLIAASVASIIAALASSSLLRGMSYSYLVRAISK